MFPNNFRSGFNWGDKHWNLPNRGVWDEKDCRQFRVERGPNRGVQWKWTSCDGKPMEWNGDTEKGQLLWQGASIPQASDFKYICTSTCPEPVNGVGIVAQSADTRIRSFVEDPKNQAKFDFDKTDREKFGWMLPIFRNGKWHTFNENENRFQGTLTSEESVAACGNPDAWDDLKKTPAPTKSPTPTPTSFPTKSPTPELTHTGNQRQCADMSKCQATPAPTPVNCGHCMVHFCPAGDTTGFARQIGDKCCQCDCGPSKICGNNGNRK